MEPTARTLARRKASLRVRRAWRKRYLDPARKCRECGCVVGDHREARQGARCERACGCSGLLTDRRGAVGARPRSQRTLRYDQVEAERAALAETERYLERWRRGLVASYAWHARREVREADMLTSLGGVAYERAFIADLVTQRHRSLALLAKPTRWY